MGMGEVNTFTRPVLADWEEEALLAKVKEGVKDGGERMHPLEVLCSGAGGNKRWTSRLH